MKKIFITGASTGLGRAAALLFAGKGWKVIATMRTPEKETELAGHDNISLLPLDVTNQEQIKTAVAKALETGDVDVVFKQRRVRTSGATGGHKRRTAGETNRHQSTWRDQDYAGFHSTLPRQKKRAVYHHYFYWWIGCISFQLCVPCYKMGARGLERKYGL